MSIKIKEVAFVFHSITDVGRARGFYEKLLGLKTGFQTEFAPGMWWIEYDVAGTAVALCNAMPGPPASALALEVEDLDGTLSAFKEAGVTLSQEVMEFPPCRMFAVKDPDGNEIRFHKLKAKG